MHATYRSLSNAEIPANGELKFRLRRFVALYDARSPVLLRRAQQLWQGTTAERTLLVEECKSNMGLLEAWELVNMAGPETAKFLALIASVASAGSCVDFRV